MRLNIEYFIIGASLVVAVAPGWISDGYMYNTTDQSELAKIFNRRSVESEPANIPKNPDEETFPTLAPEDVLVTKTAFRCLKPEPMPVFEQPHNLTEDDWVDWYRYHINRIICQNKRLNEEEIVRAEAAGEEPKKIPLDVETELEDLRQELLKAQAAYAAQMSATTETATAESATTVIVPETQTSAREAAIAAYTQSPEEIEHERRGQIIAAAIRKRLNITEEQWNNRRTKHRAQGREIDDDIPEGPEDSNDGLDEDTFRLLDNVFTSIEGGALKNMVRRSVDFEDEFSQGVVNGKTPTKVGLGNLRSISPGDLIDDTIEFAPGTLRNRKQSSRSHSADYRDSSDARNRRGGRVCRRVCSWRPESEGSRTVEAKPRKTPEPEQQKEPEWGPHNSYMNFPELNVQYRNNH